MFLPCDPDLDACEVKKGNAMDAVAKDAVEIICPFCLVRIGKTGGKCSRCGREICPEDWTVPKYDKDLDDDYSPVRSGHGVIKSMDYTDLYIPHPLDVNSKGELSKDQNPKVHLKEGWLRIGHHVSCTMEVNGTTDAVLCVIVDRNKNKNDNANKNNDTSDCWIYNCSNETGIYVNRKRLLRVRKLTNGDRIEVAGVMFKFDVDDKGPCIIAQLNESGSDSEPVITVTNLTATKSNGEPLLNKISFKVKIGEFIAVMGPSGCGKSSLIQRMAGLAPYDGSIDIPSKKVVYLPQDVERTLHPSMTLSEEIESYRRIYGLSEDEGEFEKLKEKVLRQLNLTNKVDAEGASRIGNFSGGEMRRVGLALALLRKPKILLLDEPFAGLDPENERKLTDELFKLAKNDDRTIVCVTHGLDNKEVFDRLLILGEKEGKVGQILADAKSDEVPNLDDLLASKSHGCHSVKDSPSQKLRLKKFFKSAWNDTTRLWRDLCKDLKDWWKKLPEWSCAESLRIVEGYLLRYWKENATPWYRSNFSVCFLWQPLLIVAGIRLACALDFRTDNHGLLIFCVTLSLFWLGVINCSRELVRNRVPSRCLERLGGVPTPTYLFSKYLWVLGFCLAQTLVFAALMWLVAKVPLNLSQWSDDKGMFVVWGVSKLDLSLLQSVLLFIPMFIACFLGGICGLAMSAIFRSELKATAWATNLAIFALLFSDRMVEIKDVCFQKVVWLVEWMPCYWPAQWMEDILSGRSRESWWQNVWLLVVYFVLTSMLVVSFEWKNERRWQGRTSGAGK